MAKNLVICPYCEEEKNKEIQWTGHGNNVEVYHRRPFVMGEIMDDGNFKIKRGVNIFTIISGSNFDVRCGNCGREVYRKEANGGTLGSVWGTWIHREVTISLPGTAGTGSVAY